MLRYQKWLTIIVLYVVLYSAHLSSSPSDPYSLLTASLSTYPPTTSSLKTLSPLLILLALALYAVLDIAYVVLTFNDCKDAAREIEVQVKEARREMRRRKIVK